jgi:hypothetical protein
MLMTRWIIHCFSVFRPIIYVNDLLDNSLFLGNTHCVIVFNGIGLYRLFADAVKHMRSDDKTRKISITLISC